MNAGETIRRYREKAQLSQADVAAGLRKTEGAVSQWEVGRTHPRRAVALQLDALLGADGEIASALGYTRPESAVGELQRVLDRLTAVEARLAVLESQGREQHPAGTRPAPKVVDISTAKPIRSAAKKKTIPTPD